MNVISYSLFGARELTFNKWLFNAYVTGFYWNVRMNKLLFPGWRTHVEIDSGTYSLYDTLINGLHEFYGISFGINPVSPLCKSMLWRMKPCFWDDADYVFCRDADALTSYREGEMMNHFIYLAQRDPEIHIHSVTDNKSHTLPIMGGMCGFDAKFIKEKFVSWDGFVGGESLTERGSDQDFLMKKIHRPYSHNFMGHYLKGYLGRGEKVCDHIPIRELMPEVKQELWESNLCSCFMGSAGVNNMETIRFFQRFSEDTEFEKDIALRYKEIFYWLI